VSPLEVTLEQALEFLAQPKRGRSRGRPQAEPLRSFEPSPVTGNPIELRDGRYGPYVTDGETNASIPKDVPLEDVTHESAVRFLAERAARGPGRRRGGGKAPSKRASGKTSKKKASKKAPKKDANRS
jgi:DNA topoisomerase-1